MSYVGWNTLQCNACQCPAIPCKRISLRFRMISLQCLAMSYNAPQCHKYTLQCLMPCVPWNALECLAIPCKVFHQHFIGFWRFSLWYLIEILKRFPCNASHTFLCPKILCNALHALEMPCNALQYPAKGFSENHDGFWRISLKFD